MIRGRRTDLGLGSVSLVSLAEACEVALANRKAARAGEDPVLARREARGVVTFAQAVDHYLAKKSAEFANPKHRAQ